MCFSSQKVYAKARSIIHQAADLEEKSESFIDLFERASTPLGESFLHLGTLHGAQTLPRCL